MAEGDGRDCGPSSVNEVGNFFHRQRHGDAVPVFTFSWRDNARKDEAWAAQERARPGPVAFAQEHELNYGAALKDVCIPFAWVEAGRELHRCLAGQVRPGRPRAGLDVGAGPAESVLVLRDGPLEHPPEVRSIRTASTAATPGSWCR